MCGARFNTYVAVFSCKEMTKTIHLNKKKKKVSCDALSSKLIFASCVYYSTSEVISRPGTW